MAIYTYVSNKRRDDFSSRITFSTGKDMILGEAIDLTAQEVIEVGRLAPFYNVQVGTVAVTITHQNFPPVRIYARKGTLAVTVKPYQKA